MKLWIQSNQLFRLERSMLPDPVETRDGPKGEEYGFDVIDYLFRKFVDTNRIQVVSGPAGKLLKRGDDEIGHAD